MRSRCRGRSRPRSRGGCGTGCPSPPAAAGRPSAAHAAPPSKTPAAQAASLWRGGRAGSGRSPQAGLAPARPRARPLLRRSPRGSASTCSARRTARPRPSRTTRRRAALIPPGRSSIGPGRSRHPRPTAGAAILPMRRKCFTDAAPNPDTLTPPPAHANVCSVSVTSQGQAYSQFHRALRTRNPFLALEAARELNHLTLEDALGLCLLIARTRRYQHATARWLARYHADVQGVSLTGHPRDRRPPGRPAHPWDRGRGGARCPSRGTPPRTLREPRRSSRSSRRRSCRWPTAAALRRACRREPRLGGHPAASHSRRANWRRTSRCPSGPARGLAAAR